MSAPLCTVTPLEALRRLYDVARKVDADEAQGFDTLLQGEIAVARDVLREHKAMRAAPVVPVAAQPEDEYNSFITAYRLWQAEEAPNSHPEMVHYMSDSHWKRAAGAMWRARAALAAPQPAASVTDVAKDAARYRWLRDSPNSGTAIRAIYEDGLSIPLEVDKFIDAAIAAQQGGKT